MCYRKGIYSYSKRLRCEDTKVVPKMLHVYKKERTLSADLVCASSYKERKNEQEVKMTLNANLDEFVLLHLPRRKATKECVTTYDEFNWTMNTHSHLESVVGIEVPEVHQSADFG